jgi:hypothetical protein
MMYQMPVGASVIGKAFGLLATTEHVLEVELHVGRLRGRQAERHGWIKGNGRPFHEVGTGPRRRGGRLVTVVEVVVSAGTSSLRARRHRHGGGAPQPNRKNKRKPSNRNLHKSHAFPCRSRVCRRPRLGQCCGTGTERHVTARSTCRPTSGGNGGRVAGRTRTGPYATCPRYVRRSLRCWGQARGCN